MTEPDDATVNVPTAALSFSAAHPPTVHVRDYMATRHLWSARHAARIADEIETREAGSGQFDIELESAVTGAIFSALAFAEAMVNEVLKDAFDGRPDQPNMLTEGMTPTVRSTLADLWKKGDQAGILAKYQDALTAAGSHRFDENARPYLPVDRLNNLRNTMVHFKPKSVNVDVPQPLQERLRGEFPESRLYPNGTTPWFPRMCLSSGCAQWACDSTTALVDEWWSRMGLTHDYHSHFDQWPEP